MSKDPVCARVAIIGKLLLRRRIATLATPRRGTPRHSAARLILDHMRSGGFRDDGRVRRNGGCGRSWSTRFRTRTGGRHAVHGPAVATCREDFFEADKDSSYLPKNSNLDLHLYIGHPLDDDEHLPQGATEA
jgi:hypothetical protein